MFEAYRSWQARRAAKLTLKRSLDRAYRGLVADNAWGVLEDDFDAAKAALEERYRRQGLTQKEIDKVWNRLGPVRVE